MPIIDQTGQKKQRYSYKHRSKDCGVYCILNTVDGKRYVGSAGTSIKGRWKNHIAALKNGKHGSRYLQRAWNKYGEDKFRFIVLAICLRSQCLIVEQKYIDHFKSADSRFGYNLSPKASSTLGVKYSEEYRKKMSERAKGRGKGRKFPKEFGEAISKRMKGNKNGVGPHKKPTKEQLAKRREDVTGQRFGRLVAVEYHDNNPHARWICKCDCGKKVICYLNNLKKKNTKSCGCLLKERHRRKLG